MVFTYFVINIQKTDESTIQSIFSYTSKEEALSTYHNTLASNYVSSTLRSFCVMLINEHGGTELKEYYQKPQPVPDNLVE